MIDLTLVVLVVWVVLVVVVAWCCASLRAPRDGEVPFIR